MTVVTWIMKKSRLSKLVDAAGGGTTVVSALREAEANVQPMREEAMDAIRAGLAELEALTAKPPAGDGGLWLDEIYALSSGLLDVAGPFKLEDMCAAGFSLCELADRQKRSGRIELAPLQVHVASIRLLTNDDEPPESRQAILAGLEKLIQRAGRPPA